MTERKEIVREIAKAIALELGEEGALHPPYDPTCPHIPYLVAADKALRVIETPPSTKGQKFGRCTCGNNGYTEHMIDCEMYGGNN